MPLPTKADVPPAKALHKLRRECHSLPIIRALSRLTLNAGESESEEFDSEELNSEDSRELQSEELEIHLVSH